MKQYYLKNGEKIIVREGNGEDASRIIKHIEKIICESDYLIFSKGEFIATQAEESRFIEMCKNLKNSLFLITEYRGEIIGCLTFSGGNRLKIEHYGEFGVTVLKKYWGLGIGKILVTYLINWAIESNLIKKINLKVRVDNTRAISLYKKLGFGIEGTISRFIYHRDNFYDIYVMGLEIN